MMKVYYVDDEPDLLELFADAFQGPGLEITCFGEPEAALKAIAENPPDLVFLDHGLPGMTGLEVAERMPAHLPKALVTGDVHLKVGPGFRAVFSKPFDLEEVDEFLKSFKETKAPPPAQTRAE